MYKLYKYLSQPVVFLTKVIMETNIEEGDKLKKIEYAEALDTDTSRLCIFKKVM